MQIVIAGKAHPADEGGKRLIQQMVQFTDSPDVRHRIVFLPDYDMDMAHALVQGCDVWLNNPLRPLEACGTSGMKAALNGGLNLSRSGTAGGTSGTTAGTAGRSPRPTAWPTPTRRDALEATALYELLEQVGGAAVLRPGRGRRCRSGWVEMVRHTFRSLGPKVQAEPDGPGLRDRRCTCPRRRPPATWPTAPQAAGFGPARELAAWKHRVIQAWPQVRVEHVESEAAGRRPAITGLGADRAGLGGARRAHPDDVAVEVVYGRLDDADEIVEPAYATLTAEAVRRRQRTWPATSGEVPLDQPGPFGYTVRVLPNHPLLDSRAELGLVTYPQAPAGMTNGDLR